MNQLLAQSEALPMIDSIAAAVLLAGLLLTAVWLAYLYR